MDGQPVLTELGSTLGFRRAGGIAGFGGCNGYMGPLTVTDDRITMGPLASTRRVCPERTMDQETRFMDALTKAERFAVVGTNLHLHGPAGNEQALVFIRADELQRQPR
jgi:heat shock protein HslJ